MSEQPRFLRLIVAGVDGSKGAREALRWAAGLAAATGAVVVAVHVLTYNRELFRDITPDTMRTWRRDLERELHSTWIEPLTATGVKHRSLLIESDSTAEGLLAVATQEHADAIVVGTRERGGIAGRMLGSTSYKLSHNARQAVVIVPRVH